MESENLTPLPTKQLNSELLQVAAEERTFDGAYMRSVMNMITTGFFVYRLFGEEFAEIGLVLVVFGFILYLVSLWRRKSVGRFQYVNGIEGGVAPREEEVEITTHHVGEDLQQQHDASTDQIVGASSSNAPADETQQMPRTSSTERHLSPAERRVPSQPTQNQLKAIISTLHPPEHVLQASEDTLRPRKAYSTMDPPLDAPQPKAFLAWRKKHGGTPVALYYKTSGHSVLVVTLLTVAIEVLILVLLWTRSR